MRKLIIISGSGGIGGATVSQSLMIQGFKQLGYAEQLCVLVSSDSELEKYLQQAGHGACLISFSAQNAHEYYTRTLQWATQQPRHWPLFLDSWTASRVLPSLALAIPKLRLSKRPVYHFFHDTGYSERFFSNLAKKIIFRGLNPVSLCNSRFTAQTICPRLTLKVRDIFYQPVEPDIFNHHYVTSPPSALKPILDTGASIMLTPSRISQPEQFNDKNLRALIPVLAELKASGYDYHGVVIGQDYSTNKVLTQRLLEQAQEVGVADRFTVLPAAFSIQDYYRYADVVVSLAPREPFGRTVVEAVSCGVPVIGSQTGGIGEILNHFAPQWTTDPDDPEATAAAIIRLKHDPLTSTLLAQGQRWVKEQCSPVQYARRLIEIIELDEMKSKTKEVVSV